MKKKGKDGGIDGQALIADTNKNQDNEYMPIIFSVKSDKKPHRSYVSELIGTMQIEKAVMGVLILLYNPTKDMVIEAKQAGKYKNKLFNMEYEKIKIVTVQDILNGQRLILPSMPKILKEAKRKPDKTGQIAINF